MHFGKIKNRELLSLVEYYKSISNPSFNLELIQLKDIQDKKIGIKELGKYSNENLFILDELGKSYNSKEFSNFIFNKMVNSENLTLVVGNAFGFDEEVKQKYQKFSISSMTFPHEIVLVLLLEQIYRAGTILNNSKYHK